MADLKAPQPAPKWTHSPEEVRATAEQLIAADQEALDAIASLPPAKCNFDTVFLALAHREAQHSNTVEPLEFYQHVAPAKELRDASHEAAALFEAHRVEVSMRLDLFQAKQAAQRNIVASGQVLAHEEQRLVDKMLREGTRAGLGLPEAEREELARLKKELSAACLEFIKNHSGEKGTVSFTAEELKGVPADIVSGYATRTNGDQELYDATFKMPDIMPVFKFAENPETRKRAHEAYETRLAVNAPVFDQILSIRRRLAAILGYATWADYVTEEKMAKSAQGVFAFLDDVEQRLRPVGVQERATLLAMKHEEHAEKGLPFDGEFYAWDWRYYERKFTETTLKLDDNLLRQYFPVTHVVPAVLEIYQNLLGVQFVETDGETWHPDVQMYAVWEKNAKDAGDFIGYCYLDLYPRESKFPHAAVWKLETGFTKYDGSRHYPVTAMVANHAKPGPTQPALIRHSEVVTFFHEMGHAFHNLLSVTRFARFHGTSVSGDFVEAPSKMLENWCWEPSVLSRMSSHYETKEPLPVDLGEKVAKSRYLSVGLFYLRQLFFCKFDMKVHTEKDPADTTNLWHTMKEKITLVKEDKVTPGQSWFVHLAGGHDAGYYGYTYALVFATDMYASVFKENPLDPARGRRYREKVLRPGGSQDDIDTLTDFLGRPPSSKAFVEALFGGGSPHSG